MRFLLFFLIVYALLVSPSLYGINRSISAIAQENQRGSNTGVAREYIGYVLEIRGTWVLNGETTPLSPATKLPSGGRITIKPGHEYSDTITIVNNMGSIIAQRRCLGEGACNHQPIQLPSPTKNDKSMLDRLNGFIGPAMDILWRESKKFASVISRGSEDLWKDGVVELKNGKGDLSLIITQMLKKDGGSVRRILPVDDESPIITRAPKKEHTFRLERVFPEGKTEGAPPSFTWRDDNPASAQIDGIEPGLYELQQWDRKYSDWVPMIWVLIVNSSDYQKKRSAYQEAESLASEWRGEPKDGKQAVTDETVRNFLRAYLYSQAEPGRN